MTTLTDDATPRPTSAEIAALTINLTKVKEFCNTFEIMLPGIWDDVSDEGRALWANLIAEEFNEFTDAKTRVDRLDAVCDLLYVGLGGMLSCSFHAPIYKSHGINKPLQKAVGEAVTQLRKNPPCQAGCQNDLPALTITMQRIGNGMFKYANFNGAFAAVHANNMDKLWTPEQALMPMPTNDMITMKEKKIGNTIRYLVRRASDGKIIKPPNHKKVDLTPYI